jgi:hypothetical protein
VPPTSVESPAVKGTKTILNSGQFSHRCPPKVAILTGLSRSAKAALVNTPELRELRSQTMLFVFGLQERAGHRAQSALRRR